VQPQIDANKRGSDSRSFALIRGLTIRVSRLELVFADSGTEMWPSG
jgi:hypothetical protein